MATGSTKIDNNKLLSNWRHMPEAITDVIYRYKKELSQVLADNNIRSPTPEAQLTNCSYDSNVSLEQD